MNNRNYQKELDKLLDRLQEKQFEGQENLEEKQAPGLFLHSCCAPCSSYVLEYLRVFFKIMVFYYNPNITREEEYRKRAAEQRRLIEAYNKEQAELENSTKAGGRHRGCRIGFTEGGYEPERFYQIARGLEQCPEGGERCFACYAHRLRETAVRAKAGGYDYFTTTLTISPLKNASKINEIGEKLAKEYGVAWLPSDFKKRDGYKRSIELSREYGLYRQDYCGCAYSLRA